MNDKVIAEVFQTSQVILANAQFGFALFSDSVRLAGYRCEREKVVPGEAFDEVENEYKRMENTILQQSLPKAVVALKSVLDHHLVGVLIHLPVWRFCILEQTLLHRLGHQYMQWWPVWLSLA